MTHNLLIYPSTLPGQPLERYSVEGKTLDQWLLDSVAGYTPGPEQPISATVNGVVVEPAEWAETYITRDTVVELRPQPQGGGMIIGAIIAAVVAVAATVLLRPSMPSQRNRRSQRGSSIYEASAEGNRPKLGDVIPEIAGQHKTYPDYLTSPRRYFVNRTTQAIDLLLCVGRGEYAIPSGGIKIGSTPINSLGSDVNYQIFQPGESVTGHQAHANWYNAPEVGASVGSSGLRLKSTPSVAPTWSPSAVNVNNRTISHASGSYAPNNWSTGLDLDVRVPRQIVANPPPEPEPPEVPEDPMPPQSPYAVFTGSFGDLGLSAGDAVSVFGGALAGDYIVNSVEGNELTLSYPDLAPVVSPTSGTYIATIDKTGVRYRITSFQTATVAIPPWIVRTGITVEKRLADDVIDSAWTGWSSQRVSNPHIRLHQDAANENWSGPFLACPEGETTSRLEWDIFAPQGLGYVEDNGDISSRTRSVQLQYRSLGSTNWQTVTQNVSGSSRDQMGWTFAVNLPSAMTPEVRVRRTSVEDTSTQAMDRLEWYGLRAKLPHKTSYPGVTVLALTLTGSDTIASQTESQVNLVATRRLSYKGGPLMVTRNIAPWIEHIAKSAGYTDDEIDYDELDRLDAIWRARGDYFDYVQDDDDTVKESLNRALRAGFAELTIDQGRLRPVRDEPRSTFEHMYTPQNMLDPLKRSVSAPRPDDADGVDVEYFDAETWTTETVECRLPGDQGFRAEKLRIEGVTNRTRAWRIGMRERRRQKYRRWTYSFSTELDALNSRYMSYCALADDIPGYAQSALVEGVEVDGPDVHLLSSEPLEWQAGKSHVIAWRRPDGTLAGPFPAQPGDDERHVIAQMDEVPVIDYQREPPHLLFGTTDEWSFPVLITSINPRGFESVSVDAVNYDERIYADDNGTPN